MPESAQQSAARRKALARAVERRRRAVAELLLAESLCAYAADQIGNGLSAEQARLAALEMAGELTAIAQVLRKAAWLSTADRRALAVELAGLGYPTKAIADRLGVSTRSVQNYLHGRSPAPDTRCRERSSKMRPIGAPPV